ncbi:paraslipin [Kingella negevensis]|uniref:Modulator of FtsH protease HflK n=1 Tax=Kingella negevensis TaxID=1522312 RepID=A0A238TEB4_9NEIS|nr:stomatin-like protein [Kingella negevensis]MDK4684646.1 paraslipin [Kingella negevensis]MDK4696975.1 paraslipin [Kingella negevensis]MDK4708157.1 paraslipin [Kingella negevensis]MDK4709722.1 paraslipin [Kingella negevensis]SNB78212.1 Modulator of FtsH protease HflK [Kingella negevensis]
MGLLPLVILVALVVLGFKSFKVVPQQEAHIVERLGKFHQTLNPGLNILVPFLDRVAYKHSLKEIPLDVPSQVCITRDNTQLTVDGILYFQVTDPKRASYGSSNYILAITQLAQTTLRSVIGRMELDKTFEERDDINRTVVASLDEAAVSWGVKVLRYEIKDLVPPQEILRSMQAQITAEREKRARIAQSEGLKIEQINLASGERESEIKKSEGEAQAAINASKGEKIAQINRAEGEAEAMRLVAQASADAIKIVAAAIQSPGGNEAVKLKVAEQYVEAFSKLAKENNTMIMPANVADMGSLVAAGMSIVNQTKQS